MNSRLVCLLTISAACLVACIAHADRPAEAVLNRCIAAESHAGSLQADYRRETRAGGNVTVTHGDLTLMKPNLALIHTHGAVADDEVIYRADTLNFVSYRPARKAYFSQATDTAAGHAQSTGCIEAAAFFDPTLLKTYQGQADKMELGHPVSIDNRPCADLTAHARTGGAIYHFYVGNDGLLRGVRFEIGDGLSIESRISRVRVNSLATKQVFDWKPPATARPAPGSVCRFALSETPVDPALTAVGKYAPNFPLSAAGPAFMGLHALLEKRRYVVLVFWGFG